MKDWLELCRQVKNDRGSWTIFDHATEEMRELEEEVNLSEMLEKPGEDGILGESVDVILCMLDMIATQCPDVTMEDLEAYMDKKYAKWARKYSQ